MEASVSTKPAPESSYTILWEGENPAFHEALLQELEESGIPYADKPIGEGEIADVELPDAEDEAEGESTTEPQAGQAGEERASVSVWAGDDPRTTEFLTTALRENEIPIRAMK